MSVPEGLMVVVARYGLPMPNRGGEVPMPAAMADDLAAYQGEDGCVVEVTLNHARGVMEFTVWRPGHDL